MVFPWFSKVFHGFSMVFPWFSMVFPWFSHGFRRLAGLFGVGGGIVKGPLMLEMGITPWLGYFSMGKQSGIFPWENHGKTMENLGKLWKTMEKSWENDGKIMGKLWKTKENFGKPWKNHGKIMENFGKLCENHGKIMGKLWKTMGKLWKNHGKPWKTLEKLWKNHENPWKTLENYVKTMEKSWENFGKLWNKPCEFGKWNGISFGFLAKVRNGGSCDVDSVSLMGRWRGKPLNFARNFAGRDGVSLIGMNQQIMKWA